jgi:hypothetical protein
LIAAFTSRSCFVPLIDEFYKTLAGRTGKTVDELWKRFPLDVGTDADGFNQRWQSTPPRAGNT